MLNKVQADAMEVLLNFTKEIWFSAWVTVMPTVTQSILCCPDACAETSGIRVYYCCQSCSTLAPNGV